MIIQAHDFDNLAYTSNLVIKSEILTDKTNIVLLHDNVKIYYLQIKFPST